MEFLIVKTTLENKKDAESLSNKIIESGLGACVQISEIRSTYKWKGKIETVKEYRIEIKTSSNNYKKLQEFILKHHKYELPEIIAIKITAGYGKYLNWIKEIK